MVLNFRKRVPYSQEQVAEQMRQVKELMQLRKSSQLTDEIKRFDTAIEISQEVLVFMMDEVRKYQDDIGRKST